MLKTLNDTPLHDIYPSKSYNGFFIALKAEKEFYDFIKTICNFETVFNLINPRSKTYGQNLIYSGFVENLHDELEEATNCYREGVSIDAFEQADKELDKFYSLLDPFSEIIDGDQSCLVLRICPEPNTASPFTPYFIAISTSIDNNVIIASTINRELSGAFLDEMWVALESWYNTFLSGKNSNKLWPKELNPYIFTMAGLKQIEGNKAFFEDKPWFSENLRIMSALRNMDYESVISVIDEDLEIPFNTNHAELHFVNFERPDCSTNNYVLTYLEPLGLKEIESEVDQLTQIIDSAFSVFLPLNANLTIEMLKNDANLMQQISCFMENFYEPIPEKMNIENVGKGIWVTMILIPLVKQRLDYFIEGGVLSKSKIKEKKREFDSLFSGIHLTSTSKN